MLMINLKITNVKNLIMLGISVCLLALSGCTSTTVRTTDVVPINQQIAEIEEALLLDVGVAIFDPNNEEALESVDELNVVFAEVRNAEARYFPNLLVGTLQSSSAWGAVRVVPNNKASVDIMVEGKIIHSDGETLSIHVTAKDSTGRQWLNGEYESIASRYAYDPKRGISSDAFQTIYNKVANDLLAFKRSLDRNAILNVRTVTELRFAQNFAPKTFGDHLAKDKNGNYVVHRLPADNDPMITRIRQIRERDYLFVDTMQEYYSTFAKDMKRPYWQWRQESHREVMALRTMQRSANQRIAVGTTAIIAAILAGSNSSSAVVRNAAGVAMAGGGYVIKGGLDKDAESLMHVEALQELGDSLEASIESQSIELEDRTVTLSGTVSNQYEQWREILKEIYRIDTGGQVNQ
jgi:hypothetical protein